MAVLLKYLQFLFNTAKEYNSLNFFPLPKSLSAYRKEYIWGDLRAGVNVALLVLPQSMAYALIAGLPIQYGIYGSVVAGMVAPVFSRTSLITMGPTNATSVMLLSAFAGIGITGSEQLAMVPLLILLVGVCIVLGAYLKVAGFIQYISRSVITGYITAAALLIITNQIPKALGLDLQGKKGATFYESLRLILESIQSIHWFTLGMSLITALSFLILSRTFKGLPNVAISLLFISILSATVLEPLFKHETGVQYLDAMNASVWFFELPRISLSHVQSLIAPALAISLLCILEGISIGKSLAAKTGSRFDTNQAVYSIGMANIGCAFFSGMPASGSLTRSSLSATSGGRTVLASFISGIIVLIAACAIGPYSRFIPQGALAVLVILIGCSLINKDLIRIVTFSTKSDAAVFAATFFSGMFLPLDTAIYIGVGTSIILFLRKVARPEMVEYHFKEDGQLTQIDEPKQRSIPQASIVHVEGELFFGAADIFQDQMRRICEEPNLKVIILKMRNAYNLDATGAIALQELLHYMGEKGRYLILSEVKADIIRVLKNSGLYKEIEDRNIFTDDPDNPTLSTARALRRAKEHLGDTEADISIFVNPVRDKLKKGKSL